MNPRQVGIVVACVALLAGCIPMAPTIEPEATQSDPTIVDAGSLDLTQDEVSAALTALAAAEPLTWEGGTATSKASDPGDVYLAHEAAPAECLVFYAQEELALPDDAFAQHGDVLMTASLIDLKGIGLDDNVTYAKVTVRMLDDPELATTELLDPLAAAAPECGAYTIDYTLLGWRTTEVSSLEFEDNVSLHPAASRVQTAVVTQDSMELGAVSWTLALVDNALVLVEYYGGEGAPYPDADGSREVMITVLDSIEAHRSGP